MRRLRLQAAYSRGQRTWKESSGCFLDREDQEIVCRDTRGLADRSGSLDGFDGKVHGQTMSSVKCEVKCKEPNAFHARGCRDTRVDILLDPAHIGIDLLSAFNQGESSFAFSHEPVPARKGLTGAKHLLRALDHIVVDVHPRVLHRSPGLRDRGLKTEINQCLDNGQVPTAQKIHARQGLGQF